MGIPIGKLSLYTACGGISPAYTLPVVLDVGTNNPQRLNDPLYMGWRHPRISGEEYHAFVEEFIQAVKRRWPNVLLQFEDFAQNNATPLLNRYRDEICCFNDDIEYRRGHPRQPDRRQPRRRQPAARSDRHLPRRRFRRLRHRRANHRADEVRRLERRRSARPRIHGRPLRPADRQTAEPARFPEQAGTEERQPAGWETASDAISLLDVVRNAKPTILIGVSGQPGLFTEELIREMHKHCERPIVMPLSNPTSRVEARPEDIINWTDGAATVATGSPFAPVSYKEELYPIAQCNNSYIFPGIGLGVLASGATRVTDAMLMAASRALADCSPLATDGHGALLPNIDDIQGVSKCIAMEVGKAAQLQGVAIVTSEDALSKAIEHNFWRPQYRSYKRTSF